MDFGGKIRGVIDWALDRGILSKRGFVANDLAGRREGPVPLIAAAQNFTAAWANLGPELAVDGYTRASLWFVLDDVEDSTLLDFRCMGRHTTAGTLYPMPIYNPSVAATPYVVLVEAEFIRLNNLAAINLVLTWDIANTFPFIQFQIRSDDVGQDVFAHLASAHVTYGWGS